MTTGHHFPHRHGFIRPRTKNKFTGYFERLREMGFKIRVATTTHPTCLNVINHLDSNEPFPVLDIGGSLFRNHHSGPEFGTHIGLADTRPEFTDWELVTSSPPCLGFSIPLAGKVKPS